MFRGKFLFLKVKKVSSSLITALLAAVLFVPLQAAPAQAANLLDLQYGALSFLPEPNFLKATSNLVVGFNHTYTNVATVGGQVVDARVTIDQVSGHAGNEIYSFDEYDNTPNLSFHTQVNGTSTAQASARAKIEFFESGTLNPVVLQNIRASIADLDTWEFARFYSISNYSFSSPTYLSVQTPPVPGETTIVSSATGTSNTDQTRIVQVDYSAASSFSVMFGCRANAYNTVGLDGKCGFTIDIGTPVFTGAVTAASVTQPSYSLTYDANTGTGTPPPTASVTGLTTISSPTNLTKPGYVFAGWTSNADGSGLLLDPNDSYVPTGNLTLYAKWVSANTVTFMNNGGTGVIADQTSATPTTLTANSFTRTGYDFAGWNTLAGGTGTSYTDAASYAFSANLTLYAIWTPAPLRASSQTITVIPGGSGSFTALTGATGLAGGGSNPLDPSLSCLVDPATLSCGTSVDTTDGRFELNMSSGVVTYTNNGTVPAGGAGVSISYDVTDTAAATVSGSLSPIITAAPPAPPAPTPPVATPEGITVAQGGTGTFTTITGTSGLSTQGSGAINSALTCLRDPSAISVCATTVTTTDGVFTLDRASGVVTYVNNGSTPTRGVAISYDVTDVNGLTASALLTLTITPSPVVIPTPPVVTPAPPVVAPEPPVVLPEPKPEPKPTPKPSAKPDLKRGLLNQAVKFLPVSNDTKAIAPLLPNSIKLCQKDCDALAAAGSSSSAPKAAKTAQGTWSVSALTGAVTFMPAKDWFGKAMINYVMFDELGNPVESTITVIIPAPKLPKELVYTGDDVQLTAAGGNPVQAATSLAQFALFASMLAALLLAVQAGLRRFNLARP